PCPACGCTDCPSANQSARSRSGRCKRQLASMTFRIFFPSSSVRNRNAVLFSRRCVTDRAGLPVTFLCSRLLLRQIFWRSMVQGGNLPICDLQSVPDDLYPNAL